MSTKTNKFLFSVFIILLTASFSFGANDNMMTFMKSMRQLDNIADQVEQAAAELDSKIRNPNEWYTKESHETEWAYLVDDMKSMATNVNELEKVKGLKEWQKNLADKILALTEAMTEQVKDGTEFIKKIQSMTQFNSPDYTARVAALHTYADRIDALTNYGRIRLEFDGE